MRRACQKKDAAISDPGSQLRRLGGCVQPVKGGSTTVEAVPAGGFLHLMLGSSPLQAKFIPSLTPASVIKVVLHPI